MPKQNDEPGRGHVTSSAGGAWIPAALALVLGWGFAACISFRTFEIDSRLPERPVVIDGQADDWAGRMFVVEGRKVSLGFQNDEAYLYVCLRTDFPSMERQFLRSGLTIWLDPRGGRKKVLGIKYPVGLTLGERQQWRGEAPEEGEEPGGPAGNLTDVEIFREGRRAPESLDVAALQGIELKAETVGKSFIYELKVPLAPTSGESIGLGAAPGRTVGVGFETGEVDLNNLPRRPGMIGGGASRPPVGGFGGRGGAMRPGRLRPNEPEIPEEFKVWATVKLGASGRTAPAEVKSLSH